MAQSAQKKIRPIQKPATCPPSTRPTKEKTVIVAAPLARQNHGPDKAALAAQPKCKVIESSPLSVVQEPILVDSTSATVPMDIDEKPPNNTSPESKPTAQPELTIDDIMSIPASLTLPSPSPSQTDPRYIIPPVHIDMRPGNKPSDAVVENIMTQNNEIMWPVVEWEYIEGMREVNRMLEEPLMTMEELEKELQGWWE